MSDLILPSHMKRDVMPLDKQLKMTAALASVCAMVRCQYFEARRTGINDHGDLTPEEETEFNRLLDWWNAIGREKQAMLMRMAKDLATDIHAFQGNVGQAAPDIIEVQG